MDKHEQAIKGGTASGIARQTPELRTAKAEAIRLHTELDYGLAAISRLVKFPRCSVRRWLMAAGVYKTGHRDTKRRYGFKHRRKHLRPVNILAHQRRAWVAEWRDFKPWDAETHWGNYPGIAYLRRAERMRAKTKAYYEVRKHDLEWTANRRTKAKEYNRLARIARGAKPMTPRRRTHSKWARRLRREVGQFLKKAKPHYRLSLIGCTKTVLAQWIESQFADGMNWENKNKNGGNDTATWQIDHIKPCAAFDLTDKAQRMACFHYTNLQPLWSIDNHAKRDNWIADQARHPVKESL
jgi:hypothetical protein